MAIFHLSVKIIKRSNGRSAVESAAYRSGELLYCDYDGETYDYTNKNWCEHSEIILCENAPPEYNNRMMLWNSVEASEKSSLARLCREVEIALPKELSKEDQLDLVRNFIHKNFTSNGICADFSIHNPPVRNDRKQPIDIHGNPTNDINKMQFQNPHVHILTTLRTIDEQGDWEKKSEVVYLCKKNNEEKPFTASEFKTIKNDGWEKQYQYVINNKTLWSTPSEVANQNAQRKSRAPKTTLGRENEKMAYMNATERLFEWRNSWQELVNQRYKLRGHNLHIDARSFEAQGRTDEVPSQHMGIIATKMERRAKRLLQEGYSQEQVKLSDIGNINREIRRHNQFVRQLKERLEQLYESTKDTLNSLAQKLEILRAQIVGRRYQSSILSKQHNQFKTILATQTDRIQKNYSTLSEQELKDYNTQLEKFKKLEHTVSKADSEIETISNKYISLQNDISANEKDTLTSYQMEHRTSAEETVKKQLKEHYGNGFDAALFTKAISKTDSRLNNYKNTNTNEEVYHHNDFPQRKTHVRK